MKPRLLLLIFIVLNTVAAVLLVIPTRYIISDTYTAYTHFNTALRLQRSAYADLSAIEVNASELMNLLQYLTILDATLPHVNMLPTTLSNVKKLADGISLSLNKLSTLEISDVDAEGIALKKTVALFECYGPVEEITTFIKLIEEDPAISIDSIQIIEEASVMRLRMVFSVYGRVE